MSNGNPEPKVMDPRSKEPGADERLIESFEAPVEGLALDFVLYGLGLVESVVFVVPFFRDPRLAIAVASFLVIPIVFCGRGFYRAAQSLKHGRKYLLFSDRLEICSEGREKVLHFSSILDIKPMWLGSPESTRQGVYRLRTVSGETLFLPNSERMHRLIELVLRIKDSRTALPDRSELAPETEPKGFRSAEEVDLGAHQLVSKRLDDWKSRQRVE